MQRLLARSADSLRGCMGTLKWGGEERGEGRGGEEGESGQHRVRELFQVQEANKGFCESFQIMLLCVFCPLKPILEFVFGSHLIKDLIQNLSITPC